MKPPFTLFTGQPEPRTLEVVLSKDWHPNHLQADRPGRVRRPLPGSRPEGRWRSEEVDVVGRTREGIRRREGT